MYFHKNLLISFINLSCSTTSFKELAVFSVMPAPLWIAWIASEIKVVVVYAASADFAARLLTSSATTEKPFPA